MDGYVFSGCSSLTTVYVPQCTSLGSGAFYNCTALSQLTIGSLSSIPYAAFYKTNLS